MREAGKLVIRDVPVEQYVLATTLSEVDPPAADARVLERMFEVQAILARTYVAANRGRHGRDGFDLCATTHCQIYEPARVGRSRWSAVAREAVARTRGEVLWFDGAPARAVFHADCGGHTSDAAAVWGGAPLPYLRGRRDDPPGPATHRPWTFDASVAEVHDALDADSRTSVGPLDRLDVTTRDGAGRAERVTLHGGARSVTVTGELFRDVLARAFGQKSIRSTLFTVRRSSGMFVFSGRGFGHGVGLCQTGAFARLQAGASVDAVLSFYFSGTILAH